MLRRTLIAVFLITTSWSFSALASTDEVDKNTTKVLAEVPGVSIHNTFDSLDKAIYCLRGTNDNCKRYGFPADVLGAAYGLNVEGRQFKPELWRIWAPRLEKALADSKRGPPSTEVLPQFGALDIPMLGRQLYDFDIIRALVSTNLFPYPMRITYRRSNGIAVPFVQLLSTKNTSDGPALVRACFREAATIKDGTKDADGACPDTLSASKTAKWTMIPARPTRRNPLLHDVRWTGRAERNENDRPAASQALSPCEAIPKNSTDHLGIILARLDCFVDRDAVGQAVQLSSRNGPFACDRDLDPEEAKDLRQGGCIYRMSLRIPSVAYSIYDRVKVRMYLSDQTIDKCGPARLGIEVDKPDKKFNSEEGCGAKEARFSLRGNALKADPGSGRITELGVYVHDANLQNKRVIIVLLGVDSGGLGPLFHAPVYSDWWCGPKDVCGKDDEGIIKALERQP